MKVKIKDLSVNMELGNNGVTFDVYSNDDTFLGDLRLGRGKVEWCKGRVRAGNGTTVSWNELLAFFDDVATKKAGKSASKKATRRGAKTRPTKGTTAEA